LGHALKRISQKLLGYPVKGHGARSYYVAVRRGKVPDLIIAWEIGDRSGAKIIVDTYGEIPDDYQGDAGLTWMVPEPAWSVLQMPGNLIPLAVSAVV
jgi:hypothetical protein